MALFLFYIGKENKNLERCGCLVTDNFNWRHSFVAERKSFLANLCREGITRKNGRDLKRKERGYYDILKDNFRLKRRILKYFMKWKDYDWIFN